MVRALHRSIFGRNCGASFCSIKVQGMPRRPRSTAKVRPVGPAPTIRMGGCIDKSGLVFFRTGPLAPAGPIMEGRVSPRRTKHYVAAKDAEIPRRCWRWCVLNRYGGPSPKGGEAEVTYLDGDFRIVRP